MSLLSETSPDRGAPIDDVPYLARLHPEANDRDIPVNLFAAKADEHHFDRLVALD